MTPERWQQIEEVFHAALEVGPEKRASFLNEQTDGDTDLRAEVEKLLSQFDEASSFIEQPAYESGKSGFLSVLLDETDDDPMVDMLLGAYRIEREIGRGGMGAVYEAMRADGEFRRKVAVKIVKRGMDTDFVLRRFRNERQILATLEHPYITRLLDGGTTDDGRPYFVMDYIEGEPLYRYSDRSRLTIEERLRLFINICQAVEYAHQNLVIHRDLKPNNVLISNDGTPRLLDFGIAKLLNPDLASDTLQPTATAMRMMTIDYASPEQVRGDKVTFSTDVYSLGVILFELLTGHRPYRFRNRTPHEIARVICEESAMRPSDAITRSEETLPIIHVEQEALTIRHLADLRKNSPDRLREILRGNLDNITLKALSKLPDDRYQSVKQFREDIEKHLGGRPISTPFYFPIEKAVTAQAAPNTKLIAVLPLKLFNFSASENTDDNYLSIGLADAIISRLTSVRDFTVRPTSSISGYEKSDVDPLQAGRELGVDFILDGRIKKIGETLRVSLQMLDVREGSAVWAGQFDEKFTDVLALEDAISEQVTDALISQITGENDVKLGKRGTNNPQAYEAYLKGRFYWNQFTPDSLPKAIEQFQKAVSLDLNYALAYVGIADFYIWANIYGLIPSAESYKHAEPAIDRALEINDQLGEAYATLGLIKQNRFEWQEGENLYPKAIELSPNYPNVYEWYSAVLIGCGKVEKGLKILARSEELDPLSLRTKTLVSWTKYQAGQFQDALAKANEIISLDTNFPQGHLQKGYILTEIGDPDEAVAEIEKGMSLMSDSALANFYYCFALAAANRLDDAKKVWLKMKNSTTYIKPLFLGYASIAVGEIDEAFEYLNKAVDEFDPWLVWFGTEIKLEPIRQDKRYLELMRRSKNPMLKQFEEKFLSNASQTLAVLPFKINTLASEIDTEETFLGLGLTDSLITRLSKAKQLVVRPTGSVMRFSESLDAFRAGNELEVKYVLDGNLRIAEKRVRVSVQLLNIEQNTTEWAENFDEKFTDILELEDSISDRVSKALLPHLTTDEQRQILRRETDSPEAYEAYLKGRFYWNLQTQEGFQRSIEYYQAAVSLDPDYAQAYAAIAEYYMLLGTYCVIPFAHAAKLAREAAEKTVKIAPSLAEGYAALGFVSICLDRDWIKAEELLLHAINLNSNSTTANFWHVALLTQLKRFDEALAKLKKVLELEPASPIATHMMAWVLYHARRYEESIDIHEKTLEFTPNYAWGHQTYSWALRRLGRFEDAVREAERAVQIAGDDPLYLATLAMAYAEAGSRQEAERALSRLDESSKKRFVSEYMLALVYCALGDKDEAFGYLEKAVETRDAWTNWMGVEPQFDVLRDDSRFEELLRRTRSPLAKTEFSAPQAAKSVAVLPLKFIGETATGENYLSVGLADAMITRLSQVKRFIVRPTSAILRFAEYENAFAAGGELDVDFVLGGTIRSAGKRIRITAQLYDVLSEKTLWSERFNEEFTDILDLEDAVSEKVAKALLPQLSEDERADFGKRATKNSKALEAYLRGRYHWNKFTEADLQKSIVAYQEALQHDPNFALAYAGIADFYNFLTIFGSKSPRLSFPQAKKAAQKAIELDPNLAEAYIALGVVNLGYEWNFLEAERLFMKGLYLNPNYAVGHYWYAQLLSLNGEHDNALYEMQLADKLSPGIPSLIVYHAFALRNARKFDESLEKLRQALAIQPDYYVGIQALCWTVKWTGNFDEAEESTRRALEQTDRISLLLYAYGYILAARGKTDEARKVAQELQERISQNYIPSIYLPLIYTELGEFDLAFKWLERSFEEREFWAIWLPVDPRYDALKTDQRYAEMCRRIKPLSEAEAGSHRS